MTNLYEKVSDVEFLIMGIGDMAYIVTFTTPIESVGRNSRGGTYSTYIKCKNNRTGEEGYQSFNMLGRLLKNYEFEQLNRVEV